MTTRPTPQRLVARQAVGQIVTAMSAEHITEAAGTAAVCMVLKVNEEGTK